MVVAIVKKSITDMDTDCIVNAANSGLQWGGGVCGAIFRACGHGKELQQQCNKIGGCPTGKAVITDAFDLLCKKIIHAVGPVWNGGNSGEADLLASAYRESIKLALENNMKSITFPLISAGIFGYPLTEAWKIAIDVSFEYKDKIDIYFAVLDDNILITGLNILWVKNVLYKTQIFKEKFSDYDFLIETAKDNIYLEEPAEQYTFKKGKQEDDIIVRICDHSGDEIVFFENTHRHFDGLQGIDEFDNFLQFVQELLDNNKI